MFRQAVRVAFWLALAGWLALLLRPALRKETGELPDCDEITLYLMAKALHFAVYAGLGGVAAAAFGSWRRWAVGAVAAHAVLSEIGQFFGNEWFATGRHGSLTDVLIDCGGIAFGYGVWGCVAGGQGRNLTPRPPLHAWRGGVQPAEVQERPPVARPGTELEHPLSTHGEGAGG